jgi:APA family basic amino acid/polyamine antiporter
MGILANGYLMIKLGWLNWARLIVWLVIGLVVYFTYSVKHSKVRERAASSVDVKG